MLGMIHTSSEKTIALINRMVKLSQIEHNEFKLNLKRIDAAELARQAVVNNQLMAARKEQKINFNTDGAAYSYIDGAWLSEVFDNLINNAIKYSPPGKSIEVSVRANGNGLLFQVEDEGLGFSQQDQERAFQKFARLSARPTGGETSTGLGLSIVKTLELV
jgi:signal transduction histidine kinase